MNQSTQVIVNASAHEIPLPAGMFHTVCTSPPYYSLRSYAGQQEVGWPEVWYPPMPGLNPQRIPPMRCALGLEPTPEAYIGHLVLCFREVKRVLREDGVCWIVIGDSYSGSSQTGGMNSKEGSAKRAARMFKKSAGAQRATACGTSGKEPGDSQANGHPSENLCGACRAAQNHKSHSDAQPAPMPVASPSAPNLGHKESGSDRLPTLDSMDPVARNSTATQDQPPVSILSGEQPRAVQESTTPSASHLSQGPSVRCAACGQMLAPLHSSSSDVPQSERKTVSHDAPQIDAASIQDQQAYISDNEGTSDASDHHTTDTASGFSSYPYPTTLSHHLQVKASLQQGDLMMIPHRLALALQADGWIVRNDVVWAKVAPMPESVSGWRWERCKTKAAAAPREFKGHERLQGARADNGKDFASTATWQPCPGCDKCRDTGGYVLRRGSWRHTRAHETVLMLAKGMGYYSDQERVREAQQGDGRKRGCVVSEWRGAAVGHPAHDGVQDTGTRNPRSVLTPKPESYGGAHYAVYPRTLISPLLRATAPTRVCPVCGAPWCPVVEREAANDPKCKRVQPRTWTPEDFGQDSFSGNMISGQIDYSKTTVLSHRPTCDCTPFEEANWESGIWAMPPIPGWCLDPFAGTGTTLEVCAELGVNGIGLDISPQYLDEHAKPRIGLTPSGALDELPLFEGLT